MNGWKRIGIIASVVWMLGSFLFVLEQQEKEATAMAIIVDEACISANPSQQKPCDAAMSADVTRAIPEARKSAAFVALVPIPLAWGFMYLIIFLVRWVRRGFARGSK